MSLWTKIFTMFRARAHQAGEAVVDANALRILDQEIRDASEALRKSRDDLTTMMAQRKLSQGKVVPKQQKCAEYSGFIEQLLHRGDESLAREVAQKLADLETETESDLQLLAQYDHNIDTLKKSILQAENTIARLKQQVDSVKATENVQRAQAAIASQHSGTNTALRTATDSLERIKQKQLERAAKFDAAKELEQLGSDGDLKAKLAKAGLLEDHSSADSVLARFKARPAQIGVEHSAKITPLQLENVKAKSSHTTDEQ
jgi:phage shock protein A